MRLAVICAVLGSGCHWVFALDDQAAGRFRKQIATPFAEPISDFVLPIVTSSDPELAAASPDGRDIHFVAEDGTQISHELVSYSAGTLEAWVRVDLPATFYMHYGGEPVTSDPDAVWRDFHAVWHAEDPARARDSRGGLDLTEIEGTPITTTGGIGTAVELDESAANIGDGLCAPQGQRIAVGSSSFSYAVWIRRGNLLGAFDHPFDAGGNEARVGGFAIERDSSAQTWRAVISDGVDSNGYAALDIAPVSADANWHHLAVVVERVAQTLATYLDGVMMRQVGIGEGDIATGRPICLGGLTKFDGGVDEARVHKKARVESWFRAEVASARPDYLTFGNEQPVPSALR